MGIWAAIALFIVLVLGFGAAGFALRSLFKRMDLALDVAFNPKVPEVPTGAGKPPEDWWDALQNMQLQVGALRQDFEVAITQARNDLKLARNAEERIRKRRPRSDDDELELEVPSDWTVMREPVVDPAQGDWVEEATLPGAETTSRPAPGRQVGAGAAAILAQRRGR